MDRADLSKNVLRGFTAFDLFLEQHPEFRERVTFVSQLMPSRTDVPEYAEYLERIEALVAVVNHRHGTPDCFINGIVKTPTAATFATALPVIVPIRLEPTTATFWLPPVARPTSRIDKSMNSRPPPIAA